MKPPNGFGSVYKLSGKRRKPYIVKKTVGWHYDKEKDKQVQDYITIGYSTTRAEGLQMLADYNNNPYDLEASKVTFAEVYEKWSTEKYPTVSKSNVSGYVAAYGLCTGLNDKIFKDLKLIDLQHVVDTCGKNYPTLRKLKVLFNQLYDYAIKNDICTKNYSEFVDIVRYKDRNPNKYDRNKFDKKEIDRIWEQKEDKYYQIVLMLIYNGLRVSELLDLKKENVHLDEQYFDESVARPRMESVKFQSLTKFFPFISHGLILLQIVNICFIPRIISISSTAITMTAISLHSCRT